MATTDQELIGSLKRLFEASKNAELCYRKAAGQAGRADLKVFFQECAEQRAGYAAAWQDELARVGAHDYKTTGTLGEVLQQSLAQLTSAVTGGGDEVWLAECRRTEEAAEKEYEVVLGRDLPSGVAEAARRQLAGVGAALSRLRALDAK